MHFPQTFEDTLHNDFMFELFSEQHSNVLYSISNEGYGIIGNDLYACGYFCIFGFQILLDSFIKIQVHNPMW